MVLPGLIKADIHIGALAIERLVHSLVPATSRVDGRLAEGVAMDGFMPALARRRSTAMQWNPAQPGVDV
jgi:hypothetical protein